MTAIGVTGHQGIPPGAWHFVVKGVQDILREVEPPIYAVTALVSLYLNVFVLVIQSFLKVPALSAIAPGNPPAGPVFAIVQGIVLVFFAVVTIGAIRRFRPS